MLCLMIMRNERVTYCKATKAIILLVALASSVSPVKFFGWLGLSSCPVASLVLSCRVVATNSPQGHASQRQCKGTEVGDAGFSLCGGLVKTTKSLSAF